MHADRTNRVAGVLLSLALLVGGLSVALLSLGVFGRAASERTVIENVVSAYVAEQGQWLWPAAAVVSAVIVLLCIRWIVVILTSTDRAQDFTVAGDWSRGRTTLMADAVTGAVEQEIAAYPGVVSASARLIDGPLLVLRVDLDQTGLTADVRHLIETQAVSHVRCAIDDEQLPVRVELTIVDDAGTRVR